MAFPVVQTRNETSFTSAATSFACNLPASIAAGDLLIVIIASGGTNAQQFDSTAGWSELLDENVTFGAHVFYRLADGTEGATATFTCTGSSRAASVSYRISGAADPGTQAPQISSVATGTSAAPNPNTVTPTGGAKDYLWITFFANGGTEEADDNTWLNNAATNYSQPQAVTSGTGGTNVGAILGSSERTNNAASEDAVWPASSTDTSAAWRAFTLAVHPAPPPTTTGTAKISLAAGTEPDTRTAHAIKVRARVTSGSGKIRAALYEGSTNITDTAPAYLESSALTTSLADYTLAIADADAAAIGSYANLDIWIWGYSASGGSIVYEVDQVWLEIPAASAGPKAVTPAGITSTSSITAAAVRALHRIVPAAITASSAVTAAAVRALHRIVPAAISTTSSVTAAITKTGAAKAVAPAAITATSAASASVRAQKRLTPAAITATSAASASVVAARRVIPAAISATSSVSAAITKSTASITQTGVARVSLAVGSPPTSRTAHSLHIRARVTSGAGTIRAALWQEGGAQIGSDLESSALSTSLADYTLTISDVAAATISDYAALEVRFWGYCVAGGATVFEVDQVWLELPASSPKAVTPSAITATSANTAGVVALHRIVPATISASSLITAAIRRARAVVTAAISATSAVTAVLRAQHRIVAAAISTTSAITTAIQRARAVVPAAISTTSNVTAALIKQAGGGPKAVTPAPISTTSAVTAGLIAQHRIVPAAITSTSSVGVLTLRAQRRVTPAAISTTSTVTAAVVAQHRIVPAAITSTSAASAAVTKVVAGTTQTGTARISLAPGGFPTSRTLHSIKTRARVTGGAGKLRAQLWQGGSQIGSGNLESAALTTSLADYTLTIADGDAATITDYSNLEIRFWGYCAAGGSIVFEVDQLWLELPATSPKAVAPAAITATSAITAAVVKAGPKAVIPAAITSTSAVTAAVGKQAGPRAVIPAAITATSNVTAWIPQTAKAQGGLALLWMHGAAVAKFVAPAAITSTSAVAASLRALRRVAPAAIATTSLITAAVRALKRFTPAAITATSFVSASITKPGSGPRAVAPAAISTTSAITASILRGRPVVPAALSASSTVTSSAIVAKRAVVPAAISATSSASVSVRALHRIIPAAITSTSAASASVTKPGPGPKQVAPAAIIATSTITVSALRARRALVPGAITATSNISVSLQARHLVVISAITSTSTVTAVIGRRITLGLGSITATSNVTAVIKGGLLLEQGVLVGFLGRPVGGYITSGRNGKIDEVELTPR